MRGQGFGKKIVILCLTFWFGIFTYNLTVSEKAPPEETTVAEKLNCVPDDADLQYQLLSEGKISVPAEQAGKSESKKAAELEKAIKSAEKTDKSLYRSSKDRYQYRILIHKEHCYESKGQK
ncbi:MAG TPA: hypothetical protein VGC76_04845 [Pyrinomonadaceae bacterium]|jgi:hypothetical protein